MRCCQMMLNCPNARMLNTSGNPARYPISCPILDNDDFVVVECLGNGRLNSIAYKFASDARNDDADEGQMPRPKRHHADFSPPQIRKMGFAMLFPLSNRAGKCGPS